MVCSAIYQKMIHERNLLQIDYLTKFIQNNLNSYSGQEQWQPEFSNFYPLDGIILLVGEDYNLLWKTGEDFTSTIYQHFLKKVDWKSGNQGQSYKIDNKRYYLYHRQIPGTGLSLIYLREKKISDAALNRFKFILLIVFISLLLLFLYCQQKVTRRVIKPLHELVEMVGSLMNYEYFFPLRMVEDDEIGLIKTYLFQLQDLLQKREIKLRQNLFSVMDILIDLLEIKDSYTASHSKQVRKYSIAIAQMLGLNEDEIRDIAFAATLHDIGKIGVAHRILNKPGKLTREEFAIIRQHPVVADEVLKNIEELKNIRKIVRHHHEKYDGTGYPDRLAKEEIPLGARIVSVADAFDAMTSNRPYRKALSIERAINILIEEKGRQFDPTVVDAFVKYLYQQGVFVAEVAALKE